MPGRADVQKVPVHEEHDRRRKHHEPHQDCLPEILPEGMKKGPPDVSLSAVLHFLRHIRERRQRGADGYDRNAADQKDHIQNHDIRHLREKDEDGPVHVE